jgi:hypothetical protein
VAAETLGNKKLVLGSVMRTDQSIKFFALQCVLALGVWISGWTIADTADELLGWYDKYDSSTDNEGSMKKSPFTRDADGTSILFDLAYHTVTALYAPMVLSVIMMGGYLFAFFFSWFALSPVQNCDVSNVKASDYAVNGVSFVDGIIPNLNQGTVKECKANMKVLFNAIDSNNDGFIDKCDDAKFLKASGASEEYALNYPGSASLYELEKMCYIIVPGAEMPDEFTEMFYWFLRLFTGAEHEHIHTANDK